MGDVAGNTLLLLRLDIRLQTHQINSSSATAPPQCKNNTKIKYFVSDLAPVFHCSNSFGVDFSVLIQISF